MNPIRTLDQLVVELKDQPSRRLTVAAGHDPNTIQAAARVAEEDIATVTLVGHGARIEALYSEYGLDKGLFEVRDVQDEVSAGLEAVRMVREGEADVLMKGLIGTDKYMRLILDKEQGLLPQGNILSHLSVFELPAYQQLHGKLLFAGDVAIIPAPDLSAKIKILTYCIEAAHSFGIAKPKAALIAATEKVNPKMTATTDAALIAKMADRGQIGGAVVEGPRARSNGCRRVWRALPTSSCFPTSRPATSSTRPPPFWPVRVWRQ